MKGVYRPWNRGKVLIISFLCGFLGGFLGVMNSHHFFTAPNRIATVDMTGLIRQFVKTESVLPLSAAQRQTQVHTFSQQLEDILQEIAREKQLILVPKEAVMAGNVLDVTNTVSDRLAMIPKTDTSLLQRSQ